MAAQNRRIDQLVEKIKQQQDKLEKQSVHLQALQNKVRAATSGHNTAEPPYTENHVAGLCMEILTF